MNVLEEAKVRATERKRSVEKVLSAPHNDEVGLMDSYGTMLLFSGFDFDLDELFDYINDAAHAFALALSTGDMPVEEAFRGLVADGLLTGLMIGEVRKIRELEETL